MLDSDEDPRYNIIYIYFIPLYIRLLNEVIVSHRSRFSIYFLCFCRCLIMTCDLCRFYTTVCFLRLVTTFTCV